MGNERIMFNRKATRWLGIWLDSQLKLTSHINEKMRKTRTAEVQIKGLTRMHGLVPGLVRRIQLSVVQSTALYGAELWWKGQKTTSIPFNSYLIAKHDQLQECILVPCYTHYFVKQVSSQLLFTWIIARGHTPIGYLASQISTPLRKFCLLV